MQELKEQVLESDQVHAENCWHGYMFYKNQEPELAQYYWDTLQDLVERKKKADELEEMKAIDDHPVEDIFGDEILSNDVYFKLGNDIVLEFNLKKYLIEFQQVNCYVAQ